MKENIVNEDVWKMLFKTVAAIQNFHNKTTSLHHKPSPKATFSQMRVMGCVFFSPSGKVKLKDIANELGITSGAVSQIVDVLVNEGMLKRCISETDRRAVSISFSEKGKRVRRQVDASFRILFKKLLKSVSAEKQLVFYEVLEAMTDALAEEKK